MHRSILFVVAPVALTLLLAETAQAEAWIANRFAQNCSACHSPSRRNLPTKDRRCTLACQGCHVNPNGGGLRNQYGIWNQQRFLRSVNNRKLTKWLGKKGTPAPLSKQKYANQPKVLSDKQTKAAQSFVNQGHPLLSYSSPRYNEKAHDKSDKQEKIIAKSKGEFMERVTDVDPYRLERSQYIYAGGDFRYFYLSKVRGDSDATNFPMAFDMGLRVRPTPEKFSFVSEARFLNDPGNEGLDETFATGAKVKSAYFIVDDLPYATYAMYGLYRPLFGNYTPDHEALAPRLTEFDKDHINHAFSIGGSPNVPFINAHVIMPTTNTVNKDSGFAVNLGGRFVTMGASIMASYWQTENALANTNSDNFNKDMFSLTGGIVVPLKKKGNWFNQVVLNMDVSQFEIANEVTGSDKGVVFTAESKFKMWRETYLMFNYSDANVGYSPDRTLNRKEGKTSEYMLGIKAFLLAGTEFELMTVNRQTEVLGVKSDYNYLQWQMHLFF